MIDPTQFLESLGSTPKEVAERLKDLGIKGIRASACNCPIAVVVRRFTSLPYDVRVAASGHVAIMDVGTPDPNTSAAIRTFVFQFDIGDYPELEVYVEPMRQR